MLNSEKDIVYAVAGDSEKAHEKGTEFLLSLYGVSAEPADIVISTNGGYPLDQNIYQAVKGMTAAEAAVKTGGVIVMLAASGDGTGGDSFYHMIADDDIQNSMKTILSRGRMETIPDQWEAQILIRIHMKASVIYISDMPDEIIKSMHMIPTNTLDDALETAKKIIYKDKVCITVIPDGIAVMM